jgi:small subunit ribosomal protein S15
LNKCVTTAPEAQLVSLSGEQLRFICISARIPSMITKEAKQQVIAGNQRHQTDVGSTEVQVAVLTTRIRELTEHLKQNIHDNHGRRGLLKMVGRRKRLLGYLQQKDYAGYQTLIARLGLRK